MTEWSEWYCKIQKKEYDTLQNACRECRSKGGKCMNGDNNCETCTQACKEYAKNIKPWEKQWDKIKEKYKTLYDKAKNDDTSSTEGSKDEKDVVDFLKKLYQQNKENNNIYSTAARYIHQEAKYLDCKTQTEFCEKENGDNSTSAGKENEKYAFKKPPPEYQQACNCNENVTPRPPALSNVCNTVKEHIGKNNGTQEIDNCKPKTEGTYPKWKCGDADLVTDDNVCMPPRRQKLCIIKLQYLGGTSKNDLREAFIKCAAAETFLLWHKYKEDKQKEFPSKTLHEVVQNQLNGGIIPEEFKRQMFYTFGDFRDMCLGTDISKKGDVTRGVGKVEKNIDDVFLKDGQKNDKTERKNWWDRIKENVWEGMLCGLSHHIKNGKKEELTIKTEYNYETVTFDGTTKLEEFAKRPQFLRWFTEWGEEFCKKRKEQVDILKGKCPDDTCRKGDDVKQKCTKACAEYTSWLTKWKENYQKQSQKYTDDKGQQLYKNIDDVTNSDHAYEYLGKKLTNITCSNGSTNENCVYKCMDNKSEESSMPASLDKEPQEVKGKCSCTPPPTKPEVPPAKVPSACEIVKGILTGKNENHFIGNCKRKDYQGKAYPGWNCDTEIHTKHIGACMPPRRQKLCIHFLAHPSEITKIDTQDILREAFIKSAAAETFFSWIYYKKTSSKGNDLDNTLKGGTIPPEYLRLMFYTFGDYRDFLFGTDISKNHGKESKLKEQIDTLFPTDGRTQNGLSREAWWQNYGSHIWKAMLCALEKIAGNKDKLTGHQSKYQYNSVKFSDNRNGPDLETFAKRPQFLRWFTEWGEHFCREQKKQLDILKKKCPKETCTNEGKKKECSDACKAYKEWLQTWKEHYEKQKIKYENDKDSYTNDPDTKQSPQAYQYLNKKLEKICPSGNTSANCEYKCMKYPSSQNNNNMPASLDDTPSDYKDTCECTKSQASSRNFSVRSERGDQGQRPRPARPSPPPDPRQSLARSERPPEEIPPPAQQRPSTPPKESVARILRPLDPGKEFEDDSSEEEEEEEEEKEEEPAKEDTADGEVDGEPAPPTPAPTDHKLNVCSIVKDILTGKGNLNDACDLKYNKGKNYGWKCVAPSGSKSDASGSICVPPRRRKLYIGRLTQWASDEATKRSKSLKTSGGQQTQQHTAASNSTLTTTATTKETPEASLRRAFVESAAVETFFAWHEYKMEKEKEKEEKNTADGTVYKRSDDNEEAQNQLKNGVIPEEFKRQMFYTLGDYRDICVGNVPSGIDTVIGKDTMEKIKTAIESVSKPSVPPNSEKLKSWWKQHAESIWNAMVCALTYDTNTASGQTPTQNEQVKKELLESDGKKPKTKTNNGQQDYTYGGVRLEDENS
ncbi:hypothetical protein PFMALIP_00639, partial [Plasmodium falciparum MaliPS096_E11]